MFHYKNMFLPFRQQKISLRDVMFNVRIFLAWILQQLKNNSDNISIGVKYLVSVIVHSLLDILMFNINVKHINNKVITLCIVNCRSLVDADVYCDLYRVRVETPVTLKSSKPITGYLNHGLVFHTEKLVCPKQILSPIDTLSEYILAVEKLIMSKIR